MDDLISRKALLDAYDKAHQGPPGGARKLIEEAPDAVVRCKDCSNWVPGYITDQDDFIPPKCGKYQQMVGHSADDYCSLAEKMD